VVNATGWLTPEQRAQIVGNTGLEKAVSGGCFTAIVSPDGSLLAPPCVEGESMVVADLDMALITKRKRMMDSVGHYSRPELLSLLIDRGAKPTTVDRVAPMSDAGMPGAEGAAEPPKPKAGPNRLSLTDEVMVDASR
jgi:aliphatic nitrilase